MTDEIELQDAARRLWYREGGHCVSYLIDALANGQLSINRAGPHRSEYEGGRMLQALCDAALELCVPIPDYEEAAIQAGWRDDPKRGGWWREHEGGYETPEECCHHDAIEPIDREVFEHWVVSEWLADKLIERGEKVDKDFACLCIWARTTTGQAIYCDGVIEDIARAVFGKELQCA